MPAPSTPEAARLYSYLGGFVRDDAAHGYAAADLVSAITAPVEPVAPVCRDNRLWNDPVAQPDELVRNTAARAGLTGAGQQSIQRLRERLANPPAYEVGSTAAIAEAVRAVLTREHPDVPASVGVYPNAASPSLSAPYAWGHTAVIVRTVEAVGLTDADIKAAAEQGAPDWVVIHAEIGALWEDEVDLHATWADAASAHATWTDMAEGH